MSTLFCGSAAGWQYPGTTPWLSLKLAAVVLYIGLERLAFRFARNNPVKAYCLADGGTRWVLAILRL